MPTPRLPGRASIAATDAVRSQTQRYDSFPTALAGNSRRDSNRRVRDSASAESEQRARKQPASPVPNGPSSSQAHEAPSAVHQQRLTRAIAFDVPRDNGEASTPPDDALYQIVWRGSKDSGAFELCPVEPGFEEATPAAEVSSPVPWGWRIDPAPVPEAQEAHGALIQRLLAAGWRRAGLGDAWFSDRFRPPNGLHPAEPRHSRDATNG
jgi:hypothetical protein